MGELAELEQALIRLVLRRLIKEGFKLVSVPDILSSEAIENCGMPTKGERNQVLNILLDNTKILKEKQSNNKYNIFGFIKSLLMDLLKWV
jgi:seryl-tRNA synthetase